MNYLFSDVGTLPGFCVACPPYIAPSLQTLTRNGELALDGNTASLAQI
jgi:hypothetical protein